MEFFHEQSAGTIWQMVPRISAENFKSHTKSEIDSQSETFQILNFARERIVFFNIRLPKHDEIPVVVKKFQVVEQFQFVTNSEFH